MPGSPVINKMRCVAGDSEAPRTESSAKLLLTLIQFKHCLGGSGSILFSLVKENEQAGDAV